MTAPALWVGGREVPAALRGRLRNSTDLLADGRRLREALRDDGYVYLRGVLDADEITVARKAIFSRLRDVGEIADPPDAGIATGVSHRAERAPDLGGFLEEISRGEALRRVTRGARVRSLMRDLLDDAVRPFDFLWLRFMPVGRASPLHFDHVYMNRGTGRVLSAWLPLGPVPAEDGPLLIVEGSHRFDDLIAAYRGLDAERDETRSGSFEDSPIDLATRYETRLLSADFQAGDVVIFGMFLLHGSFDNRSALGRVRLSCDLRYQAAAAPIDPRWFGARPPGHEGRGYGALGAARPLTSPPIRR